MAVILTNQRGEHTIRNVISSIVVMMLAGQVTTAFQPTKHTQTQSLLQHATINQKESSSQWALLTRLA